MFIQYNLIKIVSQSCMATSNIYYFFWYFCFVGIIVSDVKYTSSQPWPYPSALMLGCQAKASTEEIHLNEEELQDVRWFERELVEQALHNKSSELLLPPPETIAYQIIKHWVRESRCLKDSSL